MAGIPGMDVPGEPDARSPWQRLLYSWPYAVTLLACVGMLLVTAPQRSPGAQVLIVGLLWLATGCILRISQQVGIPIHLWDNRFLVHEGVLFRSLLMGMAVVLLRLSPLLVVVLLLLATGEFWLRTSLYPSGRMTVVARRLTIRAWIVSLLAGAAGGYFWAELLIRQR
jgi:hypothetical protein